MKALIVLLALCLSSCVVQKRTVEKPYIATTVELTSVGTFYQFENLTHTYCRQFLLHDFPQCEPGDTIIIKDVRKGFLKRKFTVFINYKN